MLVKGPPPKKNNNNKKLQIINKSSDDFLSMLTDWEGVLRCWAAQIEIRTVKVWEHARKHRSKSDDFRPKSRGARLGFQIKTLRIHYKTARPSQIRGKVVSEIKIDFNLCQEGAETNARHSKYNLTQRRTAIEEQYVRKYEWISRYAGLSVLRYPEWRYIVRRIKNKSQFFNLSE